MSEGECFLRSGAEKRAPKKREVKAEGRSDMPVAFHGRDHNAAPEGRQGAEKRSIPDLLPQSRYFATSRAISSGGVCGRKSLRYSPSGPIRKTMEEWSIV